MNSNNKKQQLARRYNKNPDLIYLVEEVKDWKKYTNNRLYGCKCLLENIYSKKSKR